MTSSAAAPGNAYADRRPKIPGATSGALKGLTFAAKDLFDVNGYVTGCGNPDWARTHRTAEKTALAVTRLVEAGARLEGKVHTDELAYSLNGENHFYGTPLNPRAPDRIPGGSSSGCASAVAAGACDFALGTDTGGSIRVPASYCGLFGIRPTHGRIPLDGCMPLAPSFDTAGWFTRDAELLDRVGTIFYPSVDSPKARFLFAHGLLALCDRAVSEIIQNAIARIEGQIDSFSRIEFGDELATWFEALRILQGAEAWQVHSEWILQANPTFGPATKERFAFAASLRREDIELAQRVRKVATERLTELLADGAILLMPTTPCFAPLKGMNSKDLGPLRQRILSLTCIAGLGGLPQVTMPLSTGDAPPVGMSLLGGRNSDAQLLSFVRELAET